MMNLTKSRALEWYYSDAKLAEFTRTSYRKVIVGGVHQIQQFFLKRKTIREIQEISDILYQNQCTWSLQTGNVLGIYRDGGFLKNEDDVDIAVLAKTWNVKIEEQSRQKGYQVSTYWGGYTEGSEGVHITALKKSMIFDIYPVFKDTWDGVEYRWYGGDHKHRYYFEPRLLEQTRTVQFYGIDVEIPADTDTYLRSIYGDDYMIPDPNWDWDNGPKCRLGLSPTYLCQADVDAYLFAYPAARQELLEAATETKG